MKLFKSKWDGKSVKDDGPYMSREAKSFVKGFKNMLQRELNPYGIEIVSFEGNHYDCSGFLRKGDKYVYVWYDIPRNEERIDFSKSGPFYGVLYRTAKNSKDYTGGHNNFSNIETLPGAILNLFNRMEAGMAS